MSLNEGRLPKKPRFRACGCAPTDPTSLNEGRLPKKPQSIAYGERRAPLASPQRRAASEEAAISGGRGRPTRVGALNEGRLPKKPQFTPAERHDQGVVPSTKGGFRRSRNSWVTFSVSDPPHVPQRRAASEEAAIPAGIHGRGQCEPLNEGRLPKKPQSAHAHRPQFASPWPSTKGGFRRSRNGPLSELGIAAFDGPQRRAASEEAAIREGHRRGPRPVPSTKGGFRRSRNRLQRPRRVFSR